MTIWGDLAKQWRIIEINTDRQEQIRSNVNKNLSKVKEDIVQGVSVPSAMDEVLRNDQEDEDDW